MNRDVTKRDDPILQIVGPTDNWILDRLARRLAAKLPYAQFVPWEPQMKRSSKIVYYINYSLYNRPSGMIDVAFFTHYDGTQQFLERARLVDHCVCMAQLYSNFLRARGVSNVTHIPMGFNYYRYRPRLVLGVIGRLEHPRKGRHLVEQISKLPYVEIIVTHGQVLEEDLRDLYQRLDFVLIPATVEGGPMSLLEGLALGKPVIAPEGVGIVPEFARSRHIQRYPAGNLEALIQILSTCYQQKLESTRLVQDRTWDRWAEEHHHLFMDLLHVRGIAGPKPAAGFRFGMLGDLDIPLSIDVESLEIAMDRAASHLFYGRYGLARSVLEGISVRYPFVQKLLDTLPVERPSSLVN
jgi:glycosyltransferase involved in cell wall biosynthesis